MYKPFKIWEEFIKDIHVICTEVSKYIFSGILDCMEFHTYTPRIFALLLQASKLLVIISTNLLRSGTKYYCLTSLNGLSHIWRKKAISYDFQNTILVAKHVSGNLIGLCVSSINMDSQYIIERVLDGPLIKKKVFLSEKKKSEISERLNYAAK